MLSSSSLVKNNSFRDIPTRTSRTAQPIWVKYGMEDLHIMPLSSFNFRENRYFETHTLLENIYETLPVLYIFFFNLNETRYEDDQSLYWLILEFCENRHIEGHILFYGADELLFTPFTFYFQIWVKFYVRDLHLIVLSVFELRENWRRGVVFFFSA